MKKITAERLNGLLLKAAICIDDGRSLEGQFLQENQVTLSEAIALTSQIALIIRAYLKAPQPVQQAIMLSGINEDELPDQIIWWNASRTVMATEMDYLLAQTRKIE